ncbi:hypothetical protein FNF31_04117 [Cafeteria roenbergensis]|uniref:Uncharacterized protein n=1 Tax=Cafeteria roenbergensis TaxID=33653 RepID=A0A5A8D5F6_CAFRO|nr:hypothetical protein FNF31_04117 [Cafeteria roenbergensis]
MAAREDTENRQGAVTSSAAKPALPPKSAGGLADGGAKAACSCAPVPQAVECTPSPKPTTVAKVTDGGSSGSEARPYVPDTSKMLKCATANDIRVGVRRPVGAAGGAMVKPPRAVWAFTVGKAKHQLGMDARYDNPAPFVAAAWRRLGYEPLVIVVAQDEAHAARLQGEGADGVEPLLELRAMGVEVHVTAPPPHYSPQLTGQLVRIAAPAAAPLWDAETVVTTDADMMPLSARYLQQGRRDSMVVYNHGIIHDQFAMCYIQAPSRLWREILGIPATKPYETFPEAVAATFGQAPAPHWAMDQVEVTKKITNWGKWQSEGQRVPVATFPGWRLDRISPPSTFHQHVDNWRDCKEDAIDHHMHYIMPGECGGEAAKSLTRVVELLFDAQDAAALLRYLKRVTCDAGGSAKS